MIQVSDSLAGETGWRQRLHSRQATVAFRLVLFCGLLAFAAYLRAASLKKFGMLYDEGITRAVASNIWRGDLRNNWKYVPGMPSAFHIDCYNFSSYMYADALAAGPHARHPLNWDRIFSCVCGTLALAPFFAAAVRLFNWRVALTALAVMSCFPLLVQDAHYARPEAFATLLCGVLYLLCIRTLDSPRKLLALGAAAFCCGLLIACKISFVPLAALPLVCLVARRAINPRSCLWFAAFLLAGTFAGVPDAFFHPQAFWSGVQMLTHQYSHEHPPHSLTNSPYSFGLLAPYFWQTLGPLACALSIVGLFALAGRRAYLLLALIAAPALFYAVYFSFQRVFFERNLSHVAPLIAILAAIGLVRVTGLLPARLQLTALILGLCVVLWRPLQVSRTLVFKAMLTSTLQRARESGYERRLQAREQAPLSTPSELLVPGHVDDLSTIAKRSAARVIVPTYDYDDNYTRQSLEELQRRVNARVVGRFPSLFPGFSPSTLTVYHSPALRYILLSPPAFSEVDGLKFASWESSVGKLEAPVQLRSFERNGLHPDTRLATERDIFFGSYTAPVGDGNTGEMRVGPVDAAQLQSIGIPFITGPSDSGLALSVLDHRTGRVIAQASPPPILPSWSIWRVDLPPESHGQIDIVVKDDGTGWGEWIGVGWPLRLSKPGPSIH